jgi:alkanesulfonate monooxygenase
VDGFNIAYVMAQESVENIVKYLVLELQKRGVHPIYYKEGTLREKLFDTQNFPRYRDIENINLAIQRFEILDRFCRKV